jgi:hypothetical protein
MVLNVAQDFSFIEETLSKLDDLDERNLTNIISYEAAKGVYSHARRFHNTDQNIKNFWKQRLLEFNTNSLVDNAIECIDYIKQNTPSFNEAYRELESYLPPYNYSTILYFIIGYDIGIVSDGNAYLNLGHQLFHENKRELLYFAMHELHHAVYTQINPIFSFDDLKTTKNLVNIIKYSTHLEGLAVYCSYNKRRRENEYSHHDYVTLNDLDKTRKYVARYFEILSIYENESCRLIDENDFSILDVMSGGDRLWYIVGAYMAKLIDEQLGRDTLNKTITDGPESFFEAYFKTLAD